MRPARSHVADLKFELAKWPGQNLKDLRAVRDGLLMKAVLADQALQAMRDTYESLLPEGADKDKTLVKPPPSKHVK